MKLLSIDYSSTADIPKRGRKRQVEKPDKRFDDYKQTMPVQLNLFKLLDDVSDNYSQTIELYDFVPKYVVGKVEQNRLDGQYLKPIKRVFECRGKEYQLTLIPAKIEIEEGVFKDYFLGAREEIVEDALRKLAVEGKGVMLDDELGLRFTIYQVEQELKNAGHSYSFYQVVDALKILATATIQISTQSDTELALPRKNKNLRNGKDLFFHPIETLAFNNEETKTPTFVRFSPLVTKSVRENSFRMCNYKQIMKHTSFIARQLYKRMSHHFTQADITKPYTVMLTTIIRDFGLTVQGRLKDNLKNVEAALEQMKEKDSILSYKIDKVCDQKIKTKIIDAHVRLIPSPSFSADAKKFNAKARDNQLFFTSAKSGELVGDAG